MNKQRYLAELRRLLVFMTDEDRDRAVRYYADLFDGAGPDGEQELILELGTPTKTAIRLSRGYEPGSFAAPPRDTSPRPAAVPKPADQRQTAAPEPEPAATRPPLRTDDDFWSDLLGFDMPELSMPAAEPEPEREPEPESSRRSRVRAAPSAGLPGGLGVTLFILALVLPGIPAAALFLAAMVLCAAPGCALIFGAYLAAVGGLWCIAYIADASFMFGLAFLILGIGIFVLWVGIGLDVKLARVYARGVRWAADRLLGRRVTDDETW